MASTNYYEKRDAKVRIAHELINLGWKVYGYKEDESDSMTDYYSPANWDGIATKNGYVLVVDNKYSNMSGKEITRYNPNYVSMSNADHSKIESLKNMTVEKGATEGEEENAQKLIAKIQAKYDNQTASKWEVIGHYPTYMNTTRGSIWHLEKDGAMVDKGNKLTIFDSIPDSREFDINTMEFTDRYKKVWTGNYEDGSRVMEDRQLTEIERKAVNEFKSFILRLERIVNFGNSCGDGTKETEEAFKQQNEDEKMVKKTFEKVKKVIKLEEVKRENSLQVGDVVYCSSGLCMIKEVRENLYWSVKLGSASRGYQESKKINWTLSRKSFDNGLLKGTLKVYNRVEVEEIEKVEKWVKATTKTTKKETVKTESTPETKKEVKEENKINVEFEVVEDTHTKTGEKIYVAKLVDRVEKDQFMTILSKIKKLGGYYYKYKGGFIFNEDPIELLKNNFSNSVDKQQEKNIINDEIEINEEIINNSEAENIEYKNVACNVGFEERETITINVEEEFNIDNLENLFDNVTIENDKRLNDDDNIKMEFFQTTLDNMREKFNLYLNFYHENKINTIDYDGTIKEISGVKSYKNLEYEFVDTIVFREVRRIIECVYNYFIKKYDVKLETLYHDTDYYEGRPEKMKENFNWFMNVSINDLLDDIFNQLGGMSFNDKGLKEATDKLLNDSKSYRDEDRTTVKNNKVTINNFMYYDSWGKSYGEYRNSDYEKINNLFKIISYVDTKELKNNYESITKAINNYNNKYIGEYEINDNILISFKTFKNGKVELKFNSGIQALSFAKKYLGYEE